MVKKKSIYCGLELFKILGFPSGSPRRVFVPTNRMKRSSTSDEGSAQQDGVKVPRVEADSSHINNNNNNNNNVAVPEFGEAVLPAALKLLLRNGGEMVCSEFEDGLFEHMPELKDNWPGLSEFINHFPDNLRSCEEGAKIEAFSRVEICDRFTARKGECRPFQCAKLHICKWYALDTCPEPHKDKHRFKSRHNKAVLRQHGMHGLGAAFTKQLIQRHRNRSTLPPCCVYYCNTQGCRTGRGGTQCPFLHLCCYYLQDKCRFPGTCRRSHNILDSQPASTLKAYGIDLTRPYQEMKDMLKNAGVGLTERPRNPNPRGPPRPTESDSEVDTEPEEAEVTSPTSTTKGRTTAFVPPQLASTLTHRSPAAGVTAVAPRNGARFSAANGLVAAAAAAGWPAGLPAGLPAGFTGGLPGGFTGGLTGGLPGGLTSGLPGGLTSGLPGGLGFMSTAYPMAYAAASYRSQNYPFGQAAAHTTHTAPAQHPAFTAYTATNILQIGQAQQLSPVAQAAPQMSPQISPPSPGGWHFAAAPQMTGSPVVSLASLSPGGFQRFSGQTLALTRSALGPAELAALPPSI